MSAISTSLDSLGVATEDRVEPNWVIKRVQFMAYDLRMHTPNDICPTELCNHLNRYFFSDKKFLARSRAQEATDPISRLLLHRVLSSREGAPVVLSLIYAFLGAQIGLRLEFVDLRPTCFLKFVDAGVSKYIDLTREGRILTIDDLLDSLHTRFHLASIPSAALLESVAPIRFMAEYLNTLKAEYVRESDLNRILVVQNAMMVLQPSSVHLLAERALLLRQLGHHKQALTDLKRYFSFCEKETAPTEVLSAYDELKLLVERERASMQLVD